MVVNSCPYKKAGGFCDYTGKTYHKGRIICCYTKNDNYPQNTYKKWDKCPVKRKNE
jgi:hypothetical protein